jgi:four helix bundle protein
MVPRPYATLDAWRRSHALSLRLTALCNTFPRHERFELGSQLRRAARSVPANLAEGRGAYGPGLYHRHVQIALGSLAEVDYYLLCARDEGYTSGELCDELAMEAWEIRGLLIRLANALRSRADPK